MKIGLSFLFAFLFCITPIYSGESSVEGSYGKGVKFTASDSTLSCKLNITIQPRLQAIADIDDGGAYQSEAMLRRARLKFSGFVFDPSIKFLLHIGLTNQDMQSNMNPETDNPGPIFDAYIQWDFAPKSSLLFGQCKLPGDKSRQMSFMGQNFAERSYPEGRFTPYRDIGLQFHNELNIGGAVIRDKFALTQGEGRNRKTLEGGFCYTGRLELLPLGSFSKKGDSYEPDLARETNPKLLLGGAACFNDDSWLDRSTLGKDLYEKRDITTFMADILFKYRGWSVFCEYYNRSAPNLLTMDAETNDTRYVMAGEGVSVSGSYVFPSNFGFAIRYCDVTPSKNDNYLGTERSEIEVGFAKYIKGNNLKFQLDFAKIKENATGSGDLQESLRARFHAILAL